MLGDCWGTCDPQFAAAHLKMCIPKVSTHNGAVFIQLPHLSLNSQVAW